MSFEILPEATIGIISDNIMGKYLAQAAHNMGYNVAAYSTTPNTPILQEADYCFVDNGDALVEFENFLALATIVTYTSGWLPAKLTAALKDANVPQGTELLELTDDHALGRAFSESQALNLLPYESVSSLDEVAAAVRNLGYPVVVKPIFKHKHHDDTVILRGDWDLGLVAPLIDGGALLVETWLDNLQEFSITAVRNQQGQVQLYPIRQTQRIANNLRRAWTIDDLSDEVAAVMVEITTKIAQTTTVVGAFSVNFFYSATGNLYVRDITGGIEDTAILYDVTTSFSVINQHLRAITGQALADVLLTQAGIYMPVTAEQKPALLRHWQIQPNWQVYLTTSPAVDQPAGYVLATGVAAMQLFNQLHVAGVWDFD